MRATSVSHCRCCIYHQRARLCCWHMTVTQKCIFMSLTDHMPLLSYVSYISVDVRLDSPPVVLHTATQTCRACYKSCCSLLLYFILGSQETSKQLNGSRAISHTAVEMLPAYVSNLNDAVDTTHAQQLTLVGNSKFNIVMQNVWMNNKFNVIMQTVWVQCCLNQMGMFRKTHSNLVSRCTNFQKECRIYTELDIEPIWLKECPIAA